jgi:hypothetical protein
MTAAQPQTSAYMGRELIGAVALRAGKYLATDSAGKRLGAFETSKLALAAIAQANTKASPIIH